MNSARMRPTEFPLAMPPQDFAAPPKPRREKRARSHLWRKAFVGLFALILAAWAVHEMHEVLKVNGFTAIKWALLILFSLNIVWIAFAFASATIGFIALLFDMLPLGKAKRRFSTLSGRTSVLFPIYNEDVTSVFATVEATALSLEKAPGQFDCFILSDTTDPQIALREEAAFLEMQKRLSGRALVFYRRRTINKARKSGNIEDFVTRWGGRYDYMIVYDADSYMSADTLIELALRLESEPNTGLIQTVPQLIGGKTVFARAQQFAAALYGPVLGRGIAWWAQDEGNFWGHNAIIRTEALAEAAGLPTMPGKAPFGGSILSHDFVEAAFLRRKGWRVKIAADLGGSYEEGPPTIIDLVIRDRRWCQGNLQHLAVLARARGLTWTNRLHLMMGIMAYLASPLWLALILVGLALSLQNSFLVPRYFGDGATLFPYWPVIDTARALALFWATMFILFAPKLYGLIYGLISPLWRRTVGIGRTVMGVLIEALLSALIAPILMAEQTSAVISVLLGRDSGWSPQKRGAGNYSFLTVLRRHILAMLLGIVLMGAAFAISPIFAAWLAPAGIGLIIAAPLSHWSGSPAAGERMRQAGVFATPVEIEVPSAYAEAQDRRPGYEVIEGPRFETLFKDGAVQLRRKNLCDPHWPLAPAEVHTPLALAAARADRVPSLDAYIDALSKAERLALLNSPRDLEIVSHKLTHPRDGTLHLVPRSARDGPARLRGAIRQSSTQR